MSGHAFQVFVTDDELRAALAASRAALSDDGVFAFETRNPLAREWEAWTPENWEDFTDADGAVVRFHADVELPVVADLVRFTTTYTKQGWDRPESSHSVLRFLAVDALAAFLTDAGLRIEFQFGNWDRSPVTATSPEFITLARRLPG